MIWDVSCVALVWWLTRAVLLVLGALRGVRLAGGCAGSPSGSFAVVRGGSSNPRPSRTRSLNQDNTASRGSSSPLQACVWIWIHKGPRMKKTQDTMTVRTLFDTVSCKIPSRYNNKNFQNTSFTLFLLLKTSPDFQLAQENWLSSVTFLLSHIFIWLCSYLGVSEVWEQRHFVANTQIDDSKEWPWRLGCCIISLFHTASRELHILLFYIVTCRVAYSLYSWLEAGEKNSVTWHSVHVHYYHKTDLFTSKIWSN